MTVAQRLVMAREQRGMTQADVARITMLQPAAISHFECGRREPSCANLRRLCIALQVSADWLLDLSFHGRGGLARRA